MKTLRNQLLLKLTRFLAGHLSRRELVGWATDALASQCQQAPLALETRRMPDGSIIEVLQLLRLFPEENHHRYALARVELEHYKQRLESDARRPANA